MRIANQDAIRLISEMRIANQDATRQKDEATAKPIL